MELLSHHESSVSFDPDGDGQAEASGWFGGGDGMLVFDADGSGTVSSLSEFRLSDWVDGADGDLEGLAYFDSNGDGRFDSDDDRFGDFLIWVDANGDGRSQEGELRSLSDTGIASIDLSGRGASFGLGGNTVQFLTEVTFSDGTIREAGDVAFHHEDISSIGGAVTEYGLHRIWGDGERLGHTGSDLFAILSPSAAHVVIDRFEVGQDKLFFTDEIAGSYDDISVADDGHGNAIVSLGNGAVVILTGVSSGQLDNGDFLFG